MKVYSQLEKAQAENVTSDTASEPKGMLKYRTDLNVLKVSDGATYKEMLDTDTAQTLTNKTFGDAITNTQVATPANPAAGKNKLYFKADDNLYTLDSSGNETQVGGVVASIGMGASGVSFKSSNYTIVNGDKGVVFTIDSSGGAFNLTLPTPSAGFIFTVKDGAGFLSTNPVTIVRTSGETIEGLATDYICEGDFNSYTFICDSTDWYLV
jgi:hypothetical protein